METIRKTFTDCNGRKITVTYFRIRGDRPGPVFTVIAGQHGEEHAGPCFLPEFAEEIAGKSFAGTVNICPCANPAALELDYSFYPEREDLSKLDDYYYSRFRHGYCPFGLGRSQAKTLYNMNRLWRRKDRNGVAGEISGWLWEEICENANIIIDLHCQQSRKPLIFNFCEKATPVAALSGIECVAMFEIGKDEYAHGNLAYRGNENEHSFAFCIEFSRQHELPEYEYEFGKEALRNVMRGAHMLDEPIILKRPVWRIPYVALPPENLHYVSHVGHIRYFKNHYDVVRKGDLLFELRDIQTLEVLERGIAQCDGIMNGIAYQPVMKPGILACHVAWADMLSPAGVELEKLPEDFFTK